MEHSNQSPQARPSGEVPSILNPKFPNSNAIFHFFPRLPTELRLMIWERILTRERYIKVELCTMNKRTGKMHRAGIPFKSWRLTEPYGILLHHPPKHSALFGASVESRASAQRFYRVALPCLYVTKSPSAIDSLETSDQNTEHNPQGMAFVHARPYGAKIPKRDRVLVPGTFVLNPELDTLEIDGVSLFANFANDVWDHDPRKVGLRHVAFLHQYSFSKFRKLPRYAPSEEQLRQVMARLQSVTFMHYADVARIFPKPPVRNQGLLNYCCSLPVAGPTSDFSRQQDPRIIRHEVIDNIYFDVSSRSALQQQYKEWVELVEKLGVTTPCVCKFAYTTHQSKLPISDESGTVTHTKCQSEGRELRLRERRDRYQLHAWVHLQKAAGHLNGAVETAIGFWAFPAEAVVQFSRSQNLTDRQLGCFYDLSAAQPELCLFDL
ncbi:uncharacterized protein FSUBG_3404 [Fusarium subglutinans]|uniref:2EXR domain-containing protein n=1 Tax=Gibberella subglutinans TaxID=42677 RepID=A0A8H5V410_GIBSU|nr:uncharacterized protein FSUBG_3404 [Fusarium subglutinans]KAF5610172.1 hypothetical protein FSUBG_3404 [Fusarium subglutinans]